MRPRCGIDTLIESGDPLFPGMKVGLLCHPASVSDDLSHTADLLGQRSVDLRCLFGPEHGIRGDAQDMIGVKSGEDPRLSLPVHSLYGVTEVSLRPRREWLADLDLVVVDLQDVGSRYYTYIWTMILMARACAEAGVKVTVLDRPNPLGGRIIEGPSIQPGFESFVGLHPVPVRHGMTPGEMARLVCAELSLDLNLEVVPVHPWNRQSFHERPLRSWVLPSPNMPTPDTALVYPGGCLIEGTNISEGRGTTRPFEFFGAPWIDGWKLARELAATDLPGVLFRPTTFRPMFHKYHDQACGGVQLHVRDPEEFRSFRTGVAVLLATRRLWPDDFEWRAHPYEFVTDRPAIDLLAGGRWLRDGVDRGTSLDELARPWPAAEEEFRGRRAPYLLYEEER